MKKLTPQRLDRIIAAVKRGTGRTVTREDVWRVATGDYTPSHPVDAAIHAEVNR